MQDSRSTTDPARLIERSGRVVALAGIVLPPLLIGGLKFTQIQVEALKPVIGGTPWLAWMQAAFGPERVLPVWEAGSGGFPALNALGQFLIKDVALLGIALVVIGEATASRTSTAATRRAGT